MTSTSETGHAKNVANLEELISFCTGYGATYNPSRNSIKIVQLQALLTASRAALVQTNLMATAYNNNVNVRVGSFQNIKKLGTRLVNALIASGATAATIDDAKTINRKLQGTRAKAISGTLPAASADVLAAEPVRTNSVSQQSYDNIIEHLSRIITLLSSEPLYTPNETELKVVTLNALLTGLRTANTNVISAYTTVANARISRNNILYNPLTGLCETAQQTKLYVKSVFGSTTPQYRQVSALKFNTHKN